MKKLLSITALVLFGVLAGCNKLDVKPVNVFDTDEALTSDAGVRALMATLYSRMPIEDFKYSTVEGTNGFNTWNIINHLGINTGENANRNNSTFTNPARGYWGDAYLVIRNTNNLIESLPGQSAIFTPQQIKRWVAEAHFIRAFTYFALVKRYGGVPIVKTVQQSDGTNPAEVFVQRSSEEECYDFIANDLDLAMANLDPTSENKGRANKFIAAGFKARVMIQAASIAKYGTPTVVDNIMLNGIPSAKANTYFKASYEAAKMLEGQYSLYKVKWSATDKIATADNFADLFIDPNSRENIFIKGYNFPDAVHSYDALFSPPHLANNADRFNPTLDFVELFDGIPKNAKGQINTLNSDGSYKVYNNVRELFKDAEPRLRGTVLFPGEAFRDGFVDIRRGTFIESVDPATPIARFLPDESKASYSTVPFYNTNVKTSNDQRPNGQVQIITSTGEKIYPIGLDGPTANSFATVTGFHGRKNLVYAVKAADVDLHLSTHHWIDMRYAEILLTRAEAALELFQAGQTIAGVDLQADAFNCINQIRDRAGATLLVDKTNLSSGAVVPRTEGGYVLAPNRGLQIIRIERRKELAFENKLYWDMVRWRTFDQEVNTRTWRKLNPFLFSKGAKVITSDYVEGKYIFDARYDERNSTFTFTVRNYYEPIPNGEVSKGLKPNPSN